MEVIFLGFWFSVIALIIGAIWLLVRWARGVTAKKKGEELQKTSLIPWVWAVVLLGLAVLFFVGLASSFFRGFWK